MKISISFLLLFSIPLLSYAQLKSNKVADISGKYNYVATDSLSGISLELNKDGSFSYSTNSDVSSTYAYGTWALKKDTLILNSLFDKKNIPIYVEELVVDTLKDRIFIEAIDSSNGETSDAIIRFNNDTTTECIPLFGTGCDIKIGSINNFRVDFSNYTSSKWYKVKNKKANFIRIVTNRKDVNAMFFVNKKCLFRGDKLYPLPIAEITEFDMRSGKEVKREVVLEKANR